MAEKEAEGETGHTAERVGRKEGVDAEIDLQEHHGGPTDPTGHVSSGLQGGPLREKGGRPVADPDEGFSPSTRARDLREEDVSAEELGR